MKGDSSIKVIEAIQAGDTELLQELWTDGMSVNATLYNGETPLGLAIRCQKHAMVAMLLRLGADVALRSLTPPINGQQEEAKMMFPLQIAAASRNAQILEIVFDTGPHVRHTAGNMRPLIYLAVQLKAYTLVSKLIQAAVEDDMCVVSSVDLSEPLKAAVLMRDSKMVKLLIDHGANVNRECDGLVPMVHAAQHNDMRMCLLLMNHGALINSISGTLGTAQTPLSYAIRAGMEQAVSMLLKLGSDPNSAVDWSSTGHEMSICLLPGSSMLHFGIAKNSIAMVRQLVSAGANLDNADSEGNIPLHLACMINSLDVVKYLVDFDEIMKDLQLLKNPLPPSPQTVDQPNKKGHTPLMVACMENHQDIVGLLLSVTPHLNICDSTFEKRTALHLAIEKGAESVVSMLLKAGCDVDGSNGKSRSAWFTPLHFAVRAQKHAILDQLVAFHARTDVITPNKETVLHLAARTANTDVVGRVLCYGSDINAQNNIKETALMLAVRQASTEVVQLIVSAGALLNLQDKNMETALSIAVFFGMEENARLLIANGADVSIADKRSYTPMYWAIFNNKIMALKFLLLAGAHFTKKNWNWYPKNLTTIKDKAVYRWVMDRLHSVRTLQEICRSSVRRTIIKHTPGRGIGTKVRKLPLPNKLLDFLMFENELSTIGGGESDSDGGLG